MSASSQHRPQMLQSSTSSHPLMHSWPDSPPAAASPQDPLIFGPLDMDEKPPDVHSPMGWDPDPATLDLPALATGPSAFLGPFDSYGSTAPYPIHPLSTGWPYEMGQALMSNNDSPAFMSADTDDVATAGNFCWAQWSDDEALVGGHDSNNGTGPGHATMSATSNTEHGDTTGIAAPASPSTSPTLGAATTTHIVGSAPAASGPIHHHHEPPKQLSSLPLSIPRVPFPSEPEIYSAPLSDPFMADYEAYINTQELHGHSLPTHPDFGIPPSATSLPTTPWTVQVPSAIRMSSRLRERSLPPKLAAAVSHGVIRQQLPMSMQQPLMLHTPLSSPTFPAQMQSSPYSTAAMPSFESTSPGTRSLIHDGRGRKRKRSGLSSGDKEEREKTPEKSELHPPKQAPSTWQVFFTDWLQDHRARFPHDKLNVAQAAKEAGAIYKSLSAADREALKKRAQVAKEGRDRKFAAWQRTLTPEDIKRENRFRAAQRKAGRSRKGNIKDPNAPKKPLSAYFMFLAKIRSSPELVREVFGDEAETTKQSVLAAKKWREMSDAQKKPFLSQAEQDKLEYEAARKIYESHASGNADGEAGRRAQAASVAAGIYASSFVLEPGSDHEESDGPLEDEDGDPTWAEE